MILTYKGEGASPRSLPGSSPQGLFLGLIFFVVKYNAASLRPLIPRTMLCKACKARYKTCKKENCIKHAKDTHALYIDDLSEAEAIELRKHLSDDPVQRPFPLNYHERTQQILPPGGVLQKNLDTIKIFTNNNQMKINSGKSKVMIFNKSQKYDFPPKMSFQDGKS